MNDKLINERNLLQKKSGHLAGVGSGSGIDFSGSGSADPDPDRERSSTLVKAQAYFLNYFDLIAIEFKISDRCTNYKTIRYILS